jgi:hypothetical protein
VVAIDVGTQLLQGAVTDLTVMHDRRAAMDIGGASITFSACWTVCWRAYWAAYWPV